MSYTPSYKKGDWKALCDRCGFDYKASELKETWDHLKVCNRCWERRQPQDFLKGKRDNQAVDWTRAEADDTEQDVTFSAGTALLWTEQARFTAATLLGVEYQDGLWVAVGGGGQIWTSTDDGVNWTQRTSGVSTTLRAVKYWNSNWYVVGSPSGGNPATILKSADGISWSSIVVGASVNVLTDIAFNDTTMVFIGWDSSFEDYLLKTTDGVSFSDVSNLGAVDDPTHIRWNAVDNLWGAVGATTSNLDWFGTSPDLITWTKKSTGASGSLEGLDYDGTNWIVSASPVEIHISSDSTTWTSQSENNMAGLDLKSITSGNGINLLCGGKSTASGRIIISRDNGVTWQLSYEADVSVQTMNHATYGDDIWIAVGYDGRVITGIETAPVEAQIPDGTFTNSL